MNHGDSKPTLKQQEKKNMLDELESLSRMLDDDLDLDDDKPGRPIPEDIPVLKSFVDDVPVLSERFVEDDDFIEPPVLTAPPVLQPVSPAPTLRPQQTDSLDQSAARFNTIPTLEFSGRLDDSFLDNDPLEISAAVRQHRTAPDAPLQRENSAAKPAPQPMSPAPAQPAAADTSHRLPPQAPPSVQSTVARPQPVVPASTHEAPVAARPAGVSTPVPPAPAHHAPASHTPVTSAPVISAPASTATPAQHTAASVTQPLTRFQTGNKSENPFLPKSTLDKIRENHQAYDASAELRKLIQTNPLQKLSFDASPSSKEYQALRQKASQLVNEVIRANMPRMEAELRMKLEQEVDRMFKEIRKK